MVTEIVLIDLQTLFLFVPLSLEILYNMWILVRACTINGTTTTTLTEKIVPCICYEWMVGFWGKSLQQAMLWSKGLLPTKLKCVCNSIHRLMQIYRKTTIAIVSCCALDWLARRCRYLCGYCMEAHISIDIAVWIAVVMELAQAITCACKLQMPSFIQSPPFRIVTDIVIFTASTTLSDSTSPSIYMCCGCSFPIFVNVNTTHILPSMMIAFTDMHINASSGLRC